MRARVVTALLLAGCGVAKTMQTPTTPVIVEGVDAGALDAGVMDASVVDAGPSAFDGGLSVNDVSFLFPRSAALPGLDAFLTPGQLVASQFTTDGDPPRLVSARVDPCFPAASGCVREVRLVAQALDAQGVFHDSALHLFFVFTADEWSALVRDVRALATLAAGRTAGQPLGVHPVLAAEGLDGPYGRALLGLLTTHCTPARLQEVAVMNAAVDWRFFRFSVSPAGTLTRIATTGGGPFSLFPADEVRLTRQSYGPPDSGAEGDPEGLVAPDGGVLLTVLENLAAARNFPLDAREAISRIENPLDSPTPTVDCGLCHRASQVRADHDTRRGLSPLPPRFPGAPPTAAPPPLGRNDFHAFSYHGADATITDRAVYESVLAAQGL